jgi:hypothetical protein
MQRSDDEDPRITSADSSFADFLDALDERLADIQDEARQIVALTSDVAQGLNRLTT